MSESEEKKMRICISYEGMLEEIAKVEKHLPIRACPFCGKEPSITLGYEDGEETWGIHCANGDCEIRHEIEEEELEDAVRAWEEGCEVHE